MAALLVAAKAKNFEILLVDDLSRLARDNLLMLTTIAELHFHGIKVASVADGLDTGDTEAKLGIQIRGILIEERTAHLQEVLERRTAPRPCSCGISSAVSAWSR